MASSVSRIDYALPTTIASEEELKKIVADSEERVVDSVLTTPRFFDLNVEEILEDWDVEHALREIIANAIDEQNLTNTKEIQIFKDKSIWHIRDFGRGLTYNHLTQKENPEKQAHPNSMIGKFGVGLKDAFATFDRKGIRFDIESRHGDITTEKVKKIGFESLTTLHAVVKAPSKPNMLGTDFVFYNVEDKNIKKAQDLFLNFSDEIVLETSQFGQVIQRKIDRNCRVYINGLKVAEEDNFLFSYNITSLTSEMRKALNRERSHVGRSAFSKRVQSILLACKTSKVIQLIATDLEKLAKGSSYDEMKWTNVSVHAVGILNQIQENSLFITSSQLSSNKRFLVDEATVREEHIVVIPESIADKTRSLSDPSGKPIRTLDQYIRERERSFQFTFIKPEDLSEQERDIYGYSDKIFALIGGRPEVIKELAISETMRPADTINTIGLWMSEEGKIIIHRSQLRNLSEYASTLLHEAAHALSRAPDISSKFEHKLTNLLGIITKEALRYKDPTAQDGFANSSKRKRAEEIADDD